ncbi:MAG: AMP-binding protein [Burkholderiales bacterium]|nr:AMP-binding protein [Burkholderiales bacterium]
MQPRTVRHYIDWRARTQPESAYLLAPETGRTLTYGALQRASISLARYLAALGLVKGDKVSFMLHNGLQAARLLLGAMYGGYVVQPINLLAQRSQLEYVLAHSDTRAVFVAAEFHARLRAALGASGRRIHVREVDVDAQHLFGDAEAPLHELPPIAEDDDALLMYTSGTTGKPKGCLLSHKNCIAGGEFTSAAHRLGAGDRVLCALPLYHINGQIVTAVAPLVHGGSVVMPNRFSASAYWPLVAQYRCTWLNVVPTIIAYLLHGPDPRAHGLAPSQVRFCRSASAPLPPEQHRAFEQRFGIGIIETFGMTETAAPCFTNPFDATRRKIGSPGTAFGNEAKIVDPASGATLGPRQAGEIMVRGDNVMKGYYKDAEATARAFDAEGWLRSGDLGYLDADGFLFVTGRIKELIIKGGENIAPREIDEALLRHPAVLEAAAVGIADAHYGQEILAAVVLKPGQACSEDELRAFCERELGRYKTPKRIRVLDELPKGPSGKVQRLKLVEF